MVNEFRSTDSGAPVLSGTVGAMLDVVNACLTIGRLFTTPDDSSFNDRSVEARTDGGTPFTLFPTPATGDRAYFGGQRPFNRLDLDLATLGGGGAYAFEYWNGSAWGALSVTDGTSGLTQDGAITFTPPGNWATVAVNSVTMFWVRIRPTSAPSTNPTVNSASVYGWTRPFSGTNKAVYRSLSGARRYYRVDDSGPGGGGAREARLRGFETMSTVDTGSGGFPTTAQLPAGIIPRKSASLDATARAWRVYADHRTFRWAFSTEDTAGVHFGGEFGEVFSFVPGDLYNGWVVGRFVENSASTGYERLDNLSGASMDGTLLDGHFIARAYTGIGTSLAVNKHGDVGKGVSGTPLILAGSVQYPNGAEGGLYPAPVWVYEIGGRTIRGLVRGFWHFCHAVANVEDDDTFPGAGDLAGKTFRIIRYTGNSGVYTMETSDTWRTN